MCCCVSVTSTERRNPAATRWRGRSVFHALVTKSTSRTVFRTPTPTCRSVLCSLHTCTAEWMWSVGLWLQVRFHFVRFHFDLARIRLQFDSSSTRSIVVRTLVSAGELSLSCARLLAGWVTTLWLSRPQSVSQHGQLSHPSLRGRQMSSDPCN